MGLMEGKKGIIFGVANDKSIAWAVAKQLHEAGAEIAFTYLGESLERRVRPLAESLGSTMVLPCDVTDDDQIESVFTTLKKEWGGIDFVVHSVAFANREDLRRPFYETDREGFQLALDISAYSFVAIARAARPVLNPGAGLVTMTYLGAQRYIPEYNVMGVAKAALEACTRYLAAEFGREGFRVNAVSAGPIKTLAASGIGNFNKKLKVAEDRSLLQRLVTQEEVGKASLYLLSDLSSGVTGEIHYVDSGFNVTG